MAPSTSLATTIAAAPATWAAAIEVPIHLVSIPNLVGCSKSIESCMTGRLTEAAGQSIWPLPPPGAVNVILSLRKE